MSASGTAAGARNAELAYDPLGRLWRVWDPASGTATRFLYDGDKLVMETDDSGNLRHYYVHGNGVDQPLVWWDFVGGYARRFLHADPQGSIVAVSNAQTGAPYAVNRYDPWGVPAATNKGRFQYTGQTWIGELGMYYYKARFYWPALGRFLQTDPIGYDDQVNLYAYVGNDPVNHTDPTGTADLNLHNPDPAGKYETTRRTDLPNAFTIAAHWQPIEKGVSDHRRESRRLGRLDPVYSPRELKAQAIQKGYHERTRTFLAICLVGRSGYAQAYANETKGPVVAPVGLIVIRQLRNGVEMVAEGGFREYRPNSSESRFVAERITYNPDTGRASYYLHQAGSQQSSEDTGTCRDPAKCGAGR